VCATTTADELDRALHWMDDNTGGRPYGVDVVMPATVPTEGTPVDLGTLIPAGHREFVERTLIELGLPPLPTGPGRRRPPGGARLAALGGPRARGRGAQAPDRADRERPRLAAAGRDRQGARGRHTRWPRWPAPPRTTQRHVAAGIDVVVAQGYEGRRAPGEIASMVLLPEVVDAVGADVPVLAAGGIGTGRQIAAALALGATRCVDGVDLADHRGVHAGGTQHPVPSEHCWRPARRTRCARGCTAASRRRLLQTRWTQAWAAPDAPAPLPLPLQNLLVSEAHERIAQSGDPDVVAMPVGQIVGRMNRSAPSRRCSTTCSASSPRRSTSSADCASQPGGRRAASLSAAWPQD